MKRIIKRLLALILVCVIAASFAACGGKTTDDSKNVSDSPAGSPGSSPGTSSNSGTNSNQGSSSNANAGSSPGASSQVRDTISIALSGDSGTLSPAFNALDQYGLLFGVHEPLWDQPWDGTTIWRLATGIDYITPTNWIVHLRENVKFSNGNPFTASDVIFSMWIHKNSGWVGMPRVQDIDIENCKVIDDTTLEINWLVFNVKAVGILSDMLIYDEESFDEIESTIHPIGTGPYVVTEYVLNSHLFLDARDDYWGEPPAIKHIRGRFLAEPAQRINALETGMVDASPIAAEDVEYIESFPNLEVHGRYTASWASILFNVNPASIFHNIEARYALCHAINRQAIIDVVYLGYARPMYGPLTTEDIDHEDRFDNIHPVYSIGYDVNLAKQYAESSGLAGREVVIITAGVPTAVSTAEMVQVFLKDIGVTAVIHNYDNAGYLAMRDGEPDTWDFAVTGHVSPGLVTGNRLVNEVRNMRIFNAPGLWDGYEDYLKIYQSAYSEPDPVKRREETYETVVLFTNALLYYSLCEPLNFYAINSDLDWDSFTFRSHGTTLFRDIRYK